MKLTRYSLLSLLLLTTTIVAIVGWITAGRKAQLSRREATKLRRELETLAAELGDLGVVDHTRVHAVGLRQWSRDVAAWKWKLFVPERAQLVVTLNERHVVMVPAGELILAVAIAEDESGTQLRISIDGKQRFQVPLRGKITADELQISSQVGPNDRSVWEQAERPILLKGESSSPALSNGFSVAIESA